jgi:hypothetical protein
MTPQLEYMQGSFAYYVLRDVAQAKECLAFAAEEGYGLAQHLLGEICENEKSYRMAIKYFRLAAWQGRIPAAQFKLSRLYYYGQGVRRNLEQAVKWVRMAAEGGNADAQFSLGMLHRVGEGVPRDDFQAYVLLKAAALATGPKVVDTAQQIDDVLAQIRQSLLPEQLTKAERIAAKLAQKGKPKLKKARKGEKIHIGCQDINGRVTDCSCYSLKPVGRRWKLFRTDADYNWHEDEPTDAAGLLQGLKTHGLNAQQFIAELRARPEQRLKVLADEMEHAAATWAFFTRQFTKVKMELPVGRIMVPPEPIKVDHLDDGDFLGHLIFDWHSMGGPFTLGEIKVCDGVSIAATHSYDDGYALVALIEPAIGVLWDAYYRQLFLTNGAAFKFGLFGSSLPLDIMNCNRDQLSDDLVRDAMWDAFRVMAAEDEASFQDSIGEVFERMPELEQECELELLDDIRSYPHREDERGGDGTSHLELRWLFDRYWSQRYQRSIQHGGVAKVQTAKTGKKARNTRTKR